MARYAGVPEAASAAMIHVPAPSVGVPFAGPSSCRNGSSSEGIAVSEHREPTGLVPSPWGNRRPRLWPSTLSGQVAGPGTVAPKSVAPSGPKNTTRVVCEPPKLLFLGVPMPPGRLVNEGTISRCGPLQGGFICTHTGHSQPKGRFGRR